MHWSKTSKRKEVGRKISKNTIGKKHKAAENEKNHKWKGDSVSYSGLHKWIGRKLGKPEICQNVGCSKVGFSRYEWANISGLYKRDLSDWIRLCSSCHRKWDKSGIPPAQFIV